MVRVRLRASKRYWPPSARILEHLAGHVARSAIQKRIIGQAEQGAVVIDLVKRERRCLWIDAEHQQTANGPIALPPVNTAEKQRRGACHARHRKRLIHALARQRTAIVQRVGIGAGYQDIGVQRLVGQFDTGDETAHETKLHEDENVGEGDAGNGSSEPRHAVA